VNLLPAQEINDPVEDKYFVSKSVSNTPQKQAKNGQFGKRFRRVFVDFEP
jgi:hypothetical protein